MKFLSVCSGIEAASLAWRPLGWSAVAFSEIEPFPCAVLAHHYPDTPNWGDMTKFKDWPDVSIDLLCGGTPCQSFSVAGLRKGLADPRGNLMLTFGAIAAKYRPRWLVWENVPGVLSSNDGRDFADFLGLITGQHVEVPPGGWQNSGIVAGIASAYGAAYRVLDAQYVRVESHPRAVPQRRRRVFVVGHLGDWRRAAAVLFERESMSGHPAPSRKAREGVAPTLSARTKGGGGLGTDFDCDGGLVQAFGGNNTSGAIDVATARSASASASGRMDFESETFLVAGTLDANYGKLQGASGQDANHGHSHLVPTYTLTIRGRGDSHELEYRTDGSSNAVLTPNGGRAGIGVGAIAYAASDYESGDFEEVDRAGPVTTSTDRTRAAPVIAFGTKEFAQDAGDVSPPLRAMGSSKDHPNGGGQVGVAYSTKLHNTQSNQAGKVYEGYTAGLDANSPPPALLTAMQVRRLTPLETERLQGQPDHYTAINVRSKPAADGPRYKSHGNSWAINCVRWIGERIDEVDAIQADGATA